MKKKIIAAVSLLLVAFTIGMLYVNAETNEEELPGITVVSTEAVKGGTVDVQVVISGKPEITAAQVELIYDPAVLALLGVTDNNILGELTNNPNLEIVPYSMVWEDSLNTGSAVRDGLLVTLTFKVLDEALLGTTTVKVNWAEGGIINEDGVVNIQSVAGTVNVREPKNEIKGAQVSLGTDISVKYYVELKPTDKAATMTFTMHDEKVEGVEGVLDPATGLYVFTFKGVTPQAMGDNIAAEVVLGGETLTELPTYSVLENCKNILADDPSNAVLRTLIADLMEYGAAAQKYLKYNTDALVTDDEVIKALTPTEFSALTDEWGSFADPFDGDNDNAKYYFISAGVYFDYKNTLYIRIHTDDINATRIVVGQYDMNEEDSVGEEQIYDAEDLLAQEEGEYILMLEPMVAYDLAGTDLFTTIDLQYKGSKWKSAEVLNYNLASYVYSIQNEDTPMANLAKAVYNYGLSAAAYKAAADLK